MIYKVLGIGFTASNYESFLKIWQTSYMNIEFSVSAEHTQQLLYEKEYHWAIFNSQILDCLPYIDIMRNIKTIPILIITLECTNVNQAQLVTQYLISARNALTDEGGKHRESLHMEIYTFVKNNERCVFKVEI